MMIIGCDYHPALQQIAFVDTTPGSLENESWSTAKKPNSSTKHSSGGVCWYG